MNELENSPSLEISEDLLRERMLSGKIPEDFAKFWQNHPLIGAQWNPKSRTVEFFFGPVTTKFATPGYNLVVTLIDGRDQTLPIAAIKNVMFTIASKESGSQVRLIIDPHSPSLPESLKGRSTYDLHPKHTLESVTKAIAAFTA